ncbi:MAG: MCE family protein, partial [Deltaproteobacteria bacterium]|nr:MCE family protein [Deltaproteobacteria bacterium]
MEQPTVILKKCSLSPIWILPLIALGIGAWLLYSSYRDAGIKCTIHFDNAEGITVDKTEVRYKGVAMGLVKDVTVDKDLQGVNLLVMMKRKARSSLVADSKFWIVRPEISAGKVSGLGTLLSGSYIAMRPGTSTVAATHFQGLSGPPALSPHTPGLNIILKSDALFSLQRGSPVYSKNLKIGEVQDYHLARDNSIVIAVHIRPKFSRLIRTGTRFWNSSGISIEGNLQSGFNLRTASLAALIYGGISCGTPASLRASSPQAVNGQSFALYRDFDAAQYGLPMTLKLVSGNGIIEGKTRVMYQGIKAGVVKKITVNNDKIHSVTAEILLDPRVGDILREGTRFWVIRPRISIDGIRNIDAILFGPYISLQPGNGAFRDHFTVQRGPMPEPARRPGRRYTLIAKNGGSLEIGSPVLYKKMVVGEINTLSLAADGESLRVGILVYDDFAHLVRKDSVFWDVSGISVDAGLSHFKLNIASVKSILDGGVALVNPAAPGRRAASAAAGAKFKLFASYAAAVKARPGLLPRGLALRLAADSSHSLQIGSPVLFKNITVGEITGFELNHDHRGVLLDILIFRKYADLVRSSTRFYNFSGFSINTGLRGVDVRAGSLESVVAGGIAFFTPKPGTKVRPGRKFVLYGDYDTARLRDGIHLTIHLAGAAGVRAKTPVKFKGLEIGLVKKLRFSPDMRGVIADCLVRENTATLFRDHSRLALVRPKISLSGIQHLETIVTGSYIDVIPGTGNLRTDFTILSVPPDPDAAGGLNIVLETPRPGSLGENSPVYYRRVQVGRVTGIGLSPTAQKVWVRVKIYAADAALVHKGTKFWLASGIKMSGGLFSGFTIDSESIESIVAGGIAMATPAGEEMGARAED